MATIFARVVYLLGNKALRDQIFRFVVTGFLGLFTDVSVYRTLVALQMHVTPAKALGCVMGTIVVFFINRSWTFESRQASLTQFLRFAALYGFSITINTTLNTLGLKVLPEPWQLAFICATGVSTVINFLGSKFIVFKPSPVTGDDEVMDANPDLARG